MFKNNDKSNNRNEEVLDINNSSSDDEQLLIENDQIQFKEFKGHGKNASFGRMLWSSAGQAGFKNAAAIIKTEEIIQHSIQQVSTERNVTFTIPLNDLSQRNYGGTTNHSNQVVSRKFPNVSPKNNKQPLSRSQKAAEGITQVLSVSAALIGAVQFYYFTAKREGLDVDFSDFSEMFSSIADMPWEFTKTVLSSYLFNVLLGIVFNPASLRKLVYTMMAQAEKGKNFTPIKQYFKDKRQLTADGSLPKLRILADLVSAGFGAAATSVNIFLSLEAAETMPAWMKWPFFVTANMVVAFQRVGSMLDLNHLIFNVANPQWRIIRSLQRDFKRYGLEFIGLIEMVTRAADVISGNNAQEISVDNIKSGLTRRADKDCLEKSGITIAEIIAIRNILAKGGCLTKCGNKNNAYRLISKPTMAQIAVLFASVRNNYPHLLLNWYDRSYVRDLGQWGLSVLVFSGFFYIVDPTNQFAKGLLPDSFADSVGGKVVTYVSGALLSVGNIGLNLDFAARAGLNKIYQLIGSLSTAIANAFTRTRYNDTKLTRTAAFRKLAQYYFQKHGATDVLADLFRVGAFTTALGMMLYFAFVSGEGMAQVAKESFDPNDDLTGAKAVLEWFNELLAQLTAATVNFESVIMVGALLKLCRWAFRPSDWRPGNQPKDKLYYFGKLTKEMDDFWAGLLQRSSNPRNTVDYFLYSPARQYYESELLSSDSSSDSSSDTENALISFTDNNNYNLLQSQQEPVHFDKEKDFDLGKSLPDGSNVTNLTNFRMAADIVSDVSEHKLRPVPNFTNNNAQPVAVMYNRHNFFSENEIVKRKTQRLQKNEKQLQQAKQKRRQSRAKQDQQWWPWVKDQVSSFFCCRKKSIGHQILNSSDSDENSYSSDF